MSVLATIADWLQKGSFSDYAAAVGIVVSGFIAYHIFFLSKRLGFHEKMSHADRVKDQVYKQLGKVSEGIRRRVDIVNVRRYEKDYPHKNNRSRLGYSHLRAELKTVRYNGVEFFEGMPLQAYYDRKGELTLKKTDKPTGFNVYPVGLVPFDWIEYVDLDGDEYGFYPLFYVRFKGIKRSPYKRLDFYRLREDADERKRADDLRYERVEVRRGGFLNRG